MIRVEELMIGDWVMSIHPAVPRPIRVTEIGGNDIGYKNGILSISFLEPIPITPEILEKNGIRYQFGHPWWQAAEMEDGVFEIHLTEKSTMLLKYVHQLQHALKLCGIHKNIEL